MSIKETVQVTAEHIKAGIPAYPEACPIALALIDMHPEAEQGALDVYNEFAMWAAAAEFFTAQLPPEAAEFVAHFDVGEPVGPFEFELTWETEREATS